MPRPVDTISQTKSKEVMIDKMLDLNLLALYRIITFNLHKKYGKKRYASNKNA